MDKEKKFVETLIRDHNVPCYKRYGFASRGAIARPISKEEALELLPKYDFGKGFYELCPENIDGKYSFVFNEYSEADMF